MTHAPHGAGAGGQQKQQQQQQQQRRSQPPEGSKQVEELLAPPASNGAQAAVTASDEDAALALGKTTLGGGPVAGYPSPDDSPGDSAYSSMPKPPDGGWGWVVVFASFMIHIVNDGVTYTFGIFYSALISHFDTGRGETAWILSILVGVTLCTGPISSSFVNKYGCRPVTIAGAVFGAISMALSVFAPNIYVLYLTVGLGTGFGFGLVYLPAIVSVTCYFERLRSLATGIAVCGSGLGTFLLAPIIKLLVNNLGWRYALLCVSFMVLSCAGFGALFRPLPMEPQSPTEHAPHSDEELPPKRAPSSSDLHLQRQEEPPLGASEHDLGGRKALEAAETGGGRALHRPRSVGHLPPAVVVPRSVLRGSPGSAGGSGPAGRLAASQPALAASYAYGSGMGSVETRLASSSRKSSGIMYRKDILYSGSVQHLPHHRSATHMHLEAVRLLSEETSPPSFADAAAAESRLPAANGQVHGSSLDATDAMVPRGESSRICCCTVAPETADTLREMLDVSLLRDPIFILFTISNFLTSIGYNVPYVYVEVQAKERNLDEYSAGWLLSAIGFSNTIGRIVLGYVSDKPWINRLLVYNLCLTICGVATAFSALCYSFEALMVYSCIFGCSIGAYVGLTSVVLVDLLGLDRLTNAFGLLLLFQGIASLVGPPIAGWLYDATGSYDPGFIVAGVTMALSGVMLFVIPPVQRHLRAKEEAMEMRQANGALHVAPEA